MTAPERTILYVGNFTRPWCTEVHLAASLRALGHRVVEVQENTCDWATLPDLADAELAHMLLWTRTWPAEMDVVRPVLRELSARGVPSVAYHLDLFLGLDREHQVTDQPFFACDLLVTPHRSARWSELGVNHLWQPPGVFHVETDQVPADQRRWGRYDVVFVGSHPYPHAEWEPTRTALIGAFQKEFGHRFKVLPERGRPLRGRELQTLYATVPVILGDSCMAGVADGYWSDRVPETLGRGGLLLHPECGDDIGPEGAWYADNVDLLAFPAGDVDEAVHLARTALANPEMVAGVAAHGRATVLGRDTYVHRMDTMLQHVEDTIGWRDATTGFGPSDEGAKAEPIRLEIGSGYYPTDGFTHLDLNPNAPGVDIVGPAFPLDLPDASVSELRCIDVLEHIGYRHTDEALAEWARVLVPGGRMYVQVPDAENIMIDYANNAHALVDRLPPDLPQTPLMGAAWRLLGGQDDDVQAHGGDDWTLNAHYSLWSAGSLEDALHAAGFAVEGITVNEHPNLCCWAVKR